VIRSIRTIATRWREPSFGLALLAVLVVAALLSAAVARAVLRDPAERAKAATFSIDGSARNLYPGKQMPLRLTITNPNRRPIEVTSIGVRVGSDVAKPGCPPSDFVRATSLRSAFRVPARSKKRVALKIVLLPSAPDACQGAIFPLRFVGRAVQA
jgi:hypothetical protein